ncbi:hypothetical protein [Planctomycetes bacterium Poly30]|uniref:hypothetical protein n=1 Tax=Saltatorellus ferox TaxID=2528018 RepID=UPI00119FE9D4
MSSPNTRWIVIGSVAQSGSLIQVPWLARHLHVEALRIKDWALALATVTVACVPILWLLQNSLHRAPESPRLPPSSGR